MPGRSVADRQLVEKLDLEINKEKSKLVSLWDDTNGFDFLDSPLKSVFYSTIFLEMTDIICVSAVSVHFFEVDH
jgi:hypothetical protein